MEEVNNFEFKKNKWVEWMNENYDPHDPFMATVFEEDKIVLATDLIDAQTTLQKMAVEEYKSLQDKTIELFDGLNQLIDQFNTLNPYKFSKKYKFYNKDSWLENQNKIAELDPEKVNYRTIRTIENGSTEYRPSLEVKEHSHLNEIIKDADDLAMSLAHLLAHISSMLNSPDIHLDAFKDEHPDAPF